MSEPRTDPWDLPEDTKAGHTPNHRVVLHCADCEATSPAALDVLTGPHPDAGNLKANHYDRFTTREADALLSDEGLAETHRKFTEALTDPFVHDAAKIVVELVEEIQRLRRAPDALAEAASPAALAHDHDCYGKVGLSTCRCTTASPAALDVERLTAALWGMDFSDLNAATLAHKIAAEYARLTAEQEEPRATEAERLLLQLVQAIDKYSNDRFMEWPEYRAATSLLGVKE